MTSASRTPSRALFHVPFRLRPVLTAAVVAGLLAAAGCADPTADANAPDSTAGGSTADGSAAPAANGVVYNITPDQDRIRADKDNALAAAVPADIAEDGRLTVATTAGSIPLSFHADDDRTVIGNEVDLAQIVADKLGLELDIQVTSWENWPLKTQSGDFEAVFSNVGVNAEQ